MRDWPKRKRRFVNQTKYDQQPMKAMIFAAGLGTRLAPYTSARPKALVEVAGKTLLEIAIHQLKQAGFDDIIINVHHFARQIIDYLRQNNNFGTRIAISDESDKLLETGGGLMKASWFFDDHQPFLALNVDVITDLVFTVVMNFHKKTGSLATLAVRKRKTLRYLLFDEDRCLCGWQNTETGEKIMARNCGNYEPFAFSGIQVINPEFFKQVQKTGKFSIIKTYLELAKNYDIRYFRHDEGLWIDAGKPENLKFANDFFRNRK